MTVWGACPRCTGGVVKLGASTWTTPAGPRRSVWADEPLRCSAGCPLTSGQVERLLTTVYESAALQLPLFSGSELQEVA